MKAGKRAALEADFLKLSELRGPEWVASVIRPLHLPADVVLPRDVPLPALVTIVRMFKRARRPTPAVRVI